MDWRDVDLDDFTTPVASGFEGCPVSNWRLSPEAQRRLDEQLREFDRARGRALVSAQFYFVG